MNQAPTESMDLERRVDEFCDYPHSPETQLELDVEKTIIRIGASGGMMAVGQTLISLGYALLGKPLVILGICGIIYFIYRFLVKEEFFDQVNW